MNFEAIGTVKGAGNSTQTRYYSFTDEAPIPKGWLGSWSYYRLKQTDFDGKFEYFNIEAVSCDDEINLITIYPNPADDIIHYEISISETAAVTAKVMDVLSRIVIAQSYTIQQGITQKEMKIGRAHV